MSRRVMKNANHENPVKKSSRQRPLREAQGSRALFGGYWIVQTEEAEKGRKPLSSSYSLQAQYRVPNSTMPNSQQELVATLLDESEDWNSWYLETGE